MAWLDDITRLYISRHRGANRMGSISRGDPRSNTLCRLNRHGKVGFIGCAITLHH